MPNGNIIEYEISNGLYQRAILESPDCAKPFDIAVSLVTLRRSMTTNDRDLAEMGRILLHALFGNLEPLARRMRIEAFYHKPIARNLGGELFFPRPNQMPERNRDFTMVARFSALAESLSRPQPEPVSPTNS